MKLKNSKSDLSIWNKIFKSFRELNLVFHSLTFKCCNNIRFIALWTKGVLVIHGFIHVVESTDTLWSYVHVWRSTSQHSFPLENILRKTFLLTVQYLHFKVSTEHSLQYISGFRYWLFWSDLGSCKLQMICQVGAVINCDKLCWVFLPFKNFISRFRWYTSILHGLTV